LASTSVSWNLIQRPDSVLCSATAHLSSWYIRRCRSLYLVTCLFYIHFSTFTRNTIDLWELLALSHLSLVLLCESSF
jgi:hypothetical protein